MPAISVVCLASRNWAAVSDIEQPAAGATVELGDAAAVFGDEFVTKKPRPTITPTNRTMTSRLIATSQPHQMAAFAGIAALLRAWLAANALFRLPDRRFFRPPGDGRLHRVVRSASNAFHFQIAINGVERATAQRRWLRRPAIAFQAQIHASQAASLRQRPS